MGQIRLRRSTNKHSANIISKLDKICFPDDVPVTGQDPNTIWWIAWVDGEAVGYAGLTRNKTYWFLSRAGVLPAWRGRGLQKQFIKKRVEYAQSESNLPIYSYTVLDNSASANSLISAGFRLHDPPYSWWGAVNVWKYRDKS